MKKLISILIIFATTTIACMTTAMASFVVDNTEMSHHNMMQKEMTMSSNDCCEAMKWDCEDITHECCISPFNDSWVVSNIHNSNEKKELVKWKILDFSFLALIQENQEENYIEKLNSPPIREEASKINNFYIALIGSTKSNC